MVVPTGQGSPATPHHGGSGTHLNPEGGPLQAAPLVGRGDTNTSETRRNPIQNPVWGVYYSVSTGTVHGSRGRYIGDEGISYEGVYRGGDTRKGPIHTMSG